MAPVRWGPGDASGGRQSAPPRGLGGRLAFFDVPEEEDAEGLVGVVVEEVEGFGGSGAWMPG